MKKMTIADVEDRNIWLLITFKKEEDLAEIGEIAKSVKAEHEDYTTEDLLDKINIKCPIETVEELENYDRLYF